MLTQNVVVATLALSRCTTWALIGGVDTGRRLEAFEIAIVQDVWSGALEQIQRATAGQVKVPQVLTQLYLLQHLHERRILSTSAGDGVPRMPDVTMLGGVGAGGVLCGLSCASGVVVLELGGRMEQMRER